MPAPTPIPFTKFGGLILNQPLDEVGGEAAIDLLDMDWHSGTLGSREGAKAFSAEAAASNYTSLFPHSDTRLLARKGTTLAVLEAEGKEVAGKTAAVKNGHLAFSRVGTPSASYTYIADQENTLKRYDGTDFTSPTATVDEEAGKAMPKGFYLATWADQGNRLVIAGTAASGGPNGATSGDSHVWFMSPGNAEACESTAFVQLNPGDGEAVVAGLSWGGQIFVFKETRMFVFYGISVDAAGKPIFNFNTIDLGTRLQPPSAAAGEQAVSAASGVYFVSNDGVWATTGGEPSLLSGDLDPLARSEALVGPAKTTLGERRWTGARGIESVGTDLYVALGTEGLDRVLRLDLQALRWTVWTASLNSMVAWTEGSASNNRRRLFFSGADEGDKKVYYYTSAVDTDAAVTMSPRWQTGFYELENADEKTLVMAKVWGSGEVDLKVAEDFGSVGEATTFKLGEASVIAQAQKQKGQSATLFSHQFSGTAPWSVQRIDRYLRESRVPETQKP